MNPVIAPSPGGQAKNAFRHGTPADVSRADKKDGLHLCLTTDDLGSGSQNRQRGNRIPLSHRMGEGRGEGQIPSPKAEIRKKSEFRTPNGSQTTIRAGFGFRISAFFRVSAFGV